MALLFLLVSFAVTAINQIATFVIDQYIDRINLETYCAAFTTLHPALFGALRPVCSSEYDALSAAQCSSFMNRQKIMQSRKNGSIRVAAVRHR